MMKWIICCLAILGFILACAPEKPKVETGVKSETEPKTAGGEKVVTMMKLVALLIIAPQDFQDIEYRDTRAELENAGITVKVASTDTAPKTGVMGMSVTPDIALAAARGGDSDAVVVIGGPGVLKLFDNAEAQRVIKEADAANKIVAGICLGPGVLAKAGVLKGKKATCYRSSESEAAFTQGGASWAGGPVHSDGRIITADGPAAAREFGKAVARALTGK